MIKDSHHILIVYENLFFSTMSRPRLNSLLRRLDEGCHAILVCKFTHSGGAWDMLHAGMLVLLLCVLPYELSVFGNGDGS